MPYDMDRYICLYVRIENQKRQKTTFNVRERSGSTNIPHVLSWLRRKSNSCLAFAFADFGFKLKTKSQTHTRTELYRNVVPMLMLI